MRRSGILVVVAVLAGACSGSGGGPSLPDGAPAGDGRAAGGDGGACKVPKVADGLVLARAGTAIQGAVTRAVAVAGGVLGCGDGFAAFVPASGPAKVVRDGRLAGFCGGIALDAAGKRAVVATRGGHLALLAVAAGAAPRVIDGVTRAGAAFHDVVRSGDRLWVAAGKLGVLGYRLLGDALAADAALAGAKDARGLALAGGALLVADGAVLASEKNPKAGGAEIRLISTAGKGALGAVTGLDGTATRALVQGTRGVVLRPGFGFDVIDLAGGKLGDRYAVKQEAGFPLDAVLRGDTLLVAAGSQVQRFKLGAKRATLEAVEDRPARGRALGPWIRALAAAVGGRYLVFTDTAALPLTLGPSGPAPEIDTEETTFSLLGTQTEALLRVRNTGSAPLYITGVRGEAPFSAEVGKDLAPPRPGCPGQWVVKPGDNLLVWVRRKQGSGHTVGRYHIFSNDADEADFAGRVEAGRAVARVGDRMPDFDLITVEGSRVRMADQKKKVVLAKLYNPV